MLFLSIILIIQNNNKEDIIGKVKRPSTIFWIICFIFGIILSIGTSIKFYKYTLFMIPYPSVVKKLLGIFRATGRFIWLPGYLIFFACIY